VFAHDLRPGIHPSMLGADGRRRAEPEPEAVARCRIFRDEGRRRAMAGEGEGAVFGGAGLSLSEAYVHPSLPITYTVPSLWARLAPLLRGAGGFCADSRPRAVTVGGCG
jgi:hypothetical protein